MTKVDIAPKTRVAELLDAYPELEPVLLEMSPAFKKLQNPLLRKTVARVATLQQIARIGNLELGALIGRLRAEAGLANTLNVEAGEKRMVQDVPVWFVEKNICETVDIRPMLVSGKQPMEFVLGKLEGLQQGDIFAVTAPFEVAPLLDAAGKRGFLTWVKGVSAEEVNNYFYRP